MAEHSRSPDPAAARPTCTVETIALAYLKASADDPGLALRRAIADTLADLTEAERRTRVRDRLISNGFVRGNLDAARA